MYKRLFVTGIAMLAISLAALVARAAPTEETVPLDKVPAKVRATIEKQAEGAKILKIELVTEGGKKTYDVEMQKDGKTLEFSVSPAGKYLGPKTDEPAEKAEAKPEKQPSKKTKKAAEEAKGEPVEKDGKIDGFASRFDVDKANLASVGKNPYFLPLEPGYRVILKGGSTTFTVTVTRRTKVVDGVETRVVEEREEKDGQPVEISQNYFAIDKTTGAVYYFGEDVDIYRDGKVASHEGAWLSGEGGARFGMMMPGKPKVGDKFQQEIAPKVAYDRCEIVAIGETVTTPAGTFKKCLRTKEGSAIEAGTAEKIYAPGVGLIKDDQDVLVKITKVVSKRKAAAQ